MTTGTLFGDALGLIVFVVAPLAFGCACLAVVAQSIWRRFK